MKRVKENIKKIDKDKLYSLEDALDLLMSCNHPNFDQTIDVAINLGVDPRHADQAIRGTVILPNGTGKDVRVLVVTQGDNVKVALDAGADFAGSDEYLDKIKAGWADVDVIISTPDMMPSLGRHGKVLGPKKLMPNPKSGTVTSDVDKAVKEQKSGKIEYRVDKYGIIHSGVGKVSFGKEKISGNLEALMSAVLKARPDSLKGVYIKKVTISSSMGPGVKIDKNCFKLR
ncbi:MAG: 50S ribosomal protein L1 [Candidatus Marinimicrobia bacterium]|nr:50S ribosomal protein L1 [Candidatus Neomarinimicrobiota bacterium]